jgi:hypothetical protein
MFRIARTIGVTIALATAAWAQSPQTSKPQAANKSQQATAGPLRNDRLATMPNVGVSANLNPNQNEMVGCVVNDGKHLLLDQEEMRRSYQLRGNDAQLRNSIGHLVQVTGRLVVGTTPAFEVQQVQDIQPTCNYAQSSSANPATGKAGNEGRAFNVTTTGTVGQPTPGVETEAGAKQNPSLNEHVQNFGAYRNGRPGYSASQGAPPDPRMENPMEAERIANSATRSELNNQRQLGVDAQPNYSSESNPQQTQQFTAGEAQQQRGQASGSTQVLRGGAAAGNATEAAENQAPGTAPIFLGCIEQHDNHPTLVESGSNQEFQIDARGRDLNQFANRQVRIAGNLTGTYGPAIGTEGNTAIVHVESISAVGNCAAH